VAIAAAVAVRHVVSLRFAVGGQGVNVRGVHNDLGVRCCRSSSDGEETVELGGPKRDIDLR
jgi:hypothetical protein